MNNSVPPPVPIKPIHKMSHAPVIVSATKHPSKDVVGFDISNDSHVVKIRVNPVDPVSAPSNCVISHRIQSSANTVRINITNDYAEEMLLKSASPNNPYFFYNHYPGGVLPSGQSSPSDTLDSGTCSDLDGSTPPPLPKKKNAVTVTVNRINHQRGGSLTSSGADVESDDEISCDSLNSSELDAINDDRKPPEEPVIEPIIQNVLKCQESKLPETVLQDIRDRTRVPTDEEHQPLSKKNSDRSTSSRKSSSIVEERTYQERKPKSEPVDINPDSFYKFHLNENNFDSKVSSAGVEDDETDTFAGCKGYHEGDPATATIRSSKGTIRGVKNRVRAGIATFLQMHATKTWQEKEAGKVVVYTTTMGIVRETSHRCLKIRQILRTHLVKFEEKDVFMSREVQAEIKERMNTDQIVVPQVYVEGHHIGDAELIERLNETGELRRILKPYKAAIVGYYTRKVLYFGVKNKYCVSCVRSSNSNTNTKQDHVCFKNWNGSSSSMEAASIVEGFLASEDMYGVRYAKMIADGDSSVYNSVLEARPYDDLTVTKVECRNHLLRNYCNHLKDIATTTIRSDKPDFDRGLHLKMRRIIGSCILRCRTGVTKAISHRKAEGGTQWVKSELLRKDILNGPSHVFGEHLQCKSIGYFCQGSKEGEINYIPDMKKCGIYTKVMEVVNVLADNSKHLILDVDSNMVEHYNSSVAKFTGGKRINFTQKGSYRARCAAAVVSHNTGKAYYSLHKTMLKSSPGTYSKLYENRSKRKVCHAALRNVNKPKQKVRRCLKMRQEEKETKHYGPTAQKPDMDKTLFDEKVKYHMAKLKKNEEERTNLEKQTRGQSQSEVWFEERRIRLTSSNFGLICKRKPYSSCAPVIEKLLYSSINCASTQYGTIHEKTAVKELEEKIGVKVKECGLIVDEEMPFLGATPDGLIDDDGIVEIKCPSSAELLTPHEVIERKVGVVGDMWKKTQENVFVVKRSHTYHFQVQGQLHITNRKYCLFCIWTPKGLSVHKILRDDDFWDKEMKNQLQRFYMKCVLPEIIDPRRRRSMAIREPDYILEAQEKRKGSSVTTTCK